jgi:enoyl-CoA hydratase/carnithine racemase
VTLARPLISELSNILEDLERDSGIGAIIFTGQRSVFMTGAERAELSGLHSARDVEDFLRIPHQLVHRFLNSEKLLVAALNGYCLGGGLEFALACDFRACASDLKSPSGSDLEFIGLPPSATHGKTTHGRRGTCNGPHRCFVPESYPA